MPASHNWMVWALLAVWLTNAETVAAGEEKTFATGSLIIPMDLAYQDQGMFQAYGLLFQLLRQGVPVSWVIAPAKTWHHSPCDEPGNECAWDCVEEGSGLKCPYPTASPDFSVASQVVWDDQGQAAQGDALAPHAYRGGPFVIDAENAQTALEIIDIWNNPDLWANHLWAKRTVFSVVSVHQTTAEFVGYVRKKMLAAPTIGVFSDGNENIATSYLRAAGIPQSNGNEFPDGTCKDHPCGPSTENPDMLTVPSIMGEMGTCDNRNTDHENGSLFTSDGLPAFCQIMSMHWGVEDRETVTCEGGCGNSAADCSGRAITYHGHEVVAEVRQFLRYPVHFFAECQAVNAYENTSPNPAWPWVDDPGRDGHFLTTTGQPPDCANGQCGQDGFECVPALCPGGNDCCLPSSEKEIGAGFLIAEQPNSDTLKILHPEIPYNQMDGAFETTGGSEPAYNLSTYLQTEYKNDREVTFITGANGPGDQDIWMTGFVDGVCDIGQDDAAPQAGECNSGKVSYLGGHNYETSLPLSQHPESQGTRLFLNALFEADCVTSVGQPEFFLWFTEPLTVSAHTFPVTARFNGRFANRGRGPALDATLTMAIPANVSVADQEAGGQATAAGVSWSIGSVSGNSALAGDPPSSASRWVSLSFDALGEYTLALTIDYRVGVSPMQSGPAEVTIRVISDSDGDGIADEEDPSPNDAQTCGDSDNDTCDDCAVSGQSDPANDGPDQDGDGLCDQGDPDQNGTPDGGQDIVRTGGCGCKHSSSTSLWLLGLGLLIGLVWRVFQTQSGAKP